jgi:hypothetical protein
MRAGVSPFRPSEDDLAAVALHDLHHSVHVRAVEAPSDDESLDRLVVAQAAERAQPEIARLNRDSCAQLRDRRIGGTTIGEPGAHEVHGLQRHPISRHAALPRLEVGYRVRDSGAHGRTLNTQHDLP